MPTILLRISILYNLLNSFIFSLLPKNKLFTFLFPSNPCNNFTTTHQEQEHEQIQPPSASNSVTMESPSTNKELKRVFQMFDRNGDGRITKSELNDSLENLGIFIPDKELCQMIDNIDANGDGCVDIEEFSGLYRSVIRDEQKNDEEDDEMREAFNVFDKNGDGFISGDELRSVLDSLGLRQGGCAEDCKKMIMKVDADGNGLVDFVEFKEMMKAGVFTAAS
ncbi:calmodulin-like protein 3 [Mercurialis annua]|uniref:calmodulin-like protein 3 n=1 Tax=Mercurialis annua TaxID=3986 RepID=UPI00215E909E|nr:calmodulin-like protein 3 [Mercurialis annua]